MAKTVKNKAARSTTTKKAVRAPVVGKGRGGAQSFLRPRSASDRVATRRRYQATVRYLALVKKFPLRPIRDDEELAAASAIVDSLLDKKKLTLPEQDYLHVLGNLIEEYEDEHHEIPSLPDSEMLRHLIESNDLKQVELARATGIVDTTISAVLAGKRMLTREQVGKLSQYFHVSAETFAIG